MRLTTSDYIIFEQQYTLISTNLMAFSNYIQTSFPIQAEQFEVSRTPWPSGVSFNEEEGTYSLSTETGSVPITDSDWVVINEGRTRVWTNAKFAYGFIPV